MTVQIDSREKPRAIEQILDHFRATGTTFFVSKLHLGDYMSLDRPRLVIDRKQSLGEVAANFADGRRDKSGRYYSRFMNEMLEAERLGVQLVVLVEHGGRIRSLEDVQGWVNPRLAESPLALSGERIYRKMLAYQRTYGVRWEFCDKRHTGARILEILEAGYGDEQ